MGELIMKVVIKPYTTKELGVIYNCSARTVTRDISAFRTELGERKGHRWSDHQVTIIMNYLGRPYIVVDIASPEGAEMFKKYAVAA